jgi:hypothetical protein
MRQTDAPSPLDPPDTGPDVPNPVPPPDTGDDDGS